MPSAHSHKDEITTDTRQIEDLLGAGIEALARADAPRLMALLGRAGDAAAPKTPGERERCRMKALLLEALLAETSRNLGVLGLAAVRQRSPYAISVD